MKKPTAASLGTKINHPRPVTRIHLAGAILFIVLLQTLTLLYFYPTGRTGKLEKRIDNLEALEPEARTELLLDTVAEVGKLKKRAKALEKKTNAEK